MRISPLDIRKQTFKTKMRGADAEEVRIFLELVASEFESVLQENAMMAEKLHYQEERLAEYRELEKSMRNSLVTAERIASESRDSSEREANRIVQEAQMRAERILEDARERLQALIREIEMLRGKKEVYARRFWTLLEGQLGMLQEHMQESGEVETLRERAERMLERSAAGRGGAEPDPEPAERGPAERRRESAPGREDPPPSERPRAHLSTVSGAPPTSEGDPAASSSAPRGLRGLLRRQASLPLEERGEEEAVGAREEEEEGEPGPQGVLPMGARREGIYEIRATERRRERDASGLAESGEEP